MTNLSHHVKMAPFGLINVMHIEQALHGIKNTYSEFSFNWINSYVHIKLIQSNQLIINDDMIIEHNILNKKPI